MTRNRYVDTVIGRISGMQGLRQVSERGRDLLECRRCGARFPEGTATTDGWHYACPECGEGRGIGDGLRQV
jgi:predicted RNA-binding Zn-ribbon protein involved in translation (DUF1610 family)